MIKQKRIFKTIAQTGASKVHSTTFSGSDIEIKSSGFFLIAANDHFSNHRYILCIFLTKLRNECLTVAHKQINKYSLDFCFILTNVPLELYKGLVSLGLLL